MRFFLPINRHIMNIIKSSIFLLLGFLISCSNEKKLIKRPNVVWLVAEDLGLYIPSFGDSTISTPNLSRLADEGVRYTNVYSVSGVCSLESIHSDRYVSNKYWCPPYENTFSATSNKKRSH